MQRRLVRWDMGVAVISVLIEMLKRHEGRRLFPYKCTAGKTTIGYGRNIQDTGISEEEAEFMLQADVERCILELVDKTDYFIILCEPRQTVLINMLFNLGWGRFSRFKKMIKAVREGDYLRASVEMLDSRWADQVGGRAKELSAIMLTGEY